MPVRRFLYGRNVHVQEILRGASSALAMKLLAAALGFAFNLLLSRTLGANGAGIFFLALMVATIAAVLARLGLDNALLRHLAASVAEVRWDDARAYLSLALCAAGLVSLVATTAVLLLAPVLAARLFSDAALLTPLQMMALAILPLALIQLLGQALRALKRIAASQFVLGVCVPLLTLALLVPLARSHGIAGAVLAQVLACFLTLALGIGLWRHYALRGPRSAWRSVAATLRTSSQPLFLAAMLQLIMAWAATFFLGLHANSEAVGVYNVALRAAVLIGFVLMAVNSISAPKFAALHQRRDHAGLIAAAHAAATLAALAAAPIALVMLLAPGFVMSLFGPEFSAGSTALVILALGQYLNVATGSVGNLLMMCGLEKAMRNTTMLAVVVSLTLCVLLIPAWGATGAAIATAAGMVAQNLAAAYVVWKRLGFVNIPFLRGPRADRPC
jgi:O-antigen/teichoic acid export membrane protein